jgi:phage terminase Nu1 subunit (DNA packaging protein)
MSQGEAIVVRPVEILVGIEAIRAAFGVGAKTVRKWKEKGAPIICDGGGVYRAEKAELWAWYLFMFG